MKVVNDASLVTDYMMIKIITKLTLLVDTKMTLVMEDYDTQPWQCLGLCHIYI